MSADHRARGPHSAARAAYLDDTRLDAILDRTEIGAYWSDVDGRLGGANQALCRMLGYESREAMHGLHLARTVFADPAEAAALIPGDREEFGPWIEASWVRRDRSPLRVRVAVRHSMDIDGTPRVEGIVDDLTEQLRRDEIRRRTERMATLGTTLAGVAHELNNPLAAIAGFAQLLLQQPRTEDERSAIETINHEAMRSAKIVKDLLTLARRRDADERSIIDVNDVISYIVRTRRYALETEGIACHLELSPAPLLVQGHRTHLEQVALNLFHNAEHALRDDASRSGENPRITARTRRDGDDAVIEIEDNGPGIPEAISHRIWDPFWTTKTEGEGTGLGLAVVHGIVVDHGGTISVEQAPERGARFVIRFAVAHPPEPADGRSTSAQLAPRALAILVVRSPDDDLDFPLRFLGTRGHTISSGVSDADPTASPSSGPLDVVLLSGHGAVDAVGRAAKTLATTPACRGARFVLLAPDDLEPDMTTFPPGTIVLDRPLDLDILRRAIEGT